MCVVAGSAETSSQISNTADNDERADAESFSQSKCKKNHFASRSLTKRIFRPSGDQSGARFWPRWPGMIWGGVLAPTSRICSTRSTETIRRLPSGENETNPCILALRRDSAALSAPSTSTKSSCGNSSPDLRNNGQAFAVGTEAEAAQDFFKRLGE